MDAMQIYSQPLTTERQQALALQFIAYIDRGEKTTQTCSGLDAGSRKDAQ